MDAPCRHTMQGQALLTPAAGFPLIKRQFNVDAIYVFPRERGKGTPPCDLERGNLTVPAPALSVG